MIPGRKLGNACGNQSRLLLRGAALDFLFQIGASADSSIQEAHQEPEAPCLLAALVGNMVFFSHPDRIIEIKEQSLCCPSESQHVPLTHQNLLPEHGIHGAGFSQKFYPRFPPFGLKHYYNCYSGGFESIQMLKDPEPATGTDSRILHHAE
jgi:hypothetical protein